MYCDTILAMLVCSCQPGRCYVE